ncbi:hypothetical protein GCM10025876_29190 [Demequina litorisediminis]|uniref:MrpA C-terminal/MbhD domain-containing protein n=1 Tax=Demequina litorisediminis TaxID=1849022 RepID=A0ABQ6IFQ7_9MICO|nr:hydrogenase subunit MbhD domain-containing protein [Demequina litorisediminis]GMA36715.1 hypothetical protein GCM10025876_29190 [Demequina litorisediminis]
MAPALLSVFGVATGLAPRILEPYLEPYAESYGEEPTYHLALWHGFEPALWLTIAVIVVGTAMFVWRGPLLRMQGRLPRVPDASRGYTASIRAINWAGLVTSRALQRRGLPGYLAMILGVFVFSVVASAIAGADLVGSIVPWDYPTQAVVAAFMIVAAIASAMVRQRFTAVLLVGMVGYGMVALFGMHGAPDLALTQALVETVTLVVFVLVLRRLPHRIAERNVPRRRLLRAGIGIAVGLAMALVAVVALGSRTADSISAEPARDGPERGPRPERGQRASRGHPGLGHHGRDLHARRRRHRRGKPPVRHRTRGLRGAPGASRVRHLAAQARRHRRGRHRASRPGRRHQHRDRLVLRGGRVAV